MTNTTGPVSVLAIFLRDAVLRVPVRPYENELPLKVEIDLNATWRDLEHPGHCAVTQTAKVTGVNEAGVLCFEASVTLELIAAVNGFEGEEREQVASHYLPGLLFAHCRARLAMLTADTGYGVIHLPPLEASRVPPATKVA